MNYKLKGFFGVVLLASLSMGVACKKEALAGGVEYKITFTRTWSAATHPFEFPKEGVTSGHFSGWIGASHNANYTLFREAGMATMGLEMLAEEGKHNPLDQEIKAAMAAGNTGMLVETNPLLDVSSMVESKIMVSDKFPMVSLVAMIAPSPCWFAGANDISLKDGDSWVGEKMVTVYAWNAGTDDGATYMAADAEANPKKPIKMADTQHFMKDGMRVPVATIMFKKM